MNRAMLTERLVVVFIAAVAVAYVIGAVAITLAINADSGVHGLAAKANAQADLAAMQSRVQCQRTRAFAPSIADAYQRYHLLTPQQLEAYRETIPKSCP